MLFQGTSLVKSLFGPGFVTSDLPLLLANITANTALYNVYAEEPNVPAFMIGQIILTSPFTSSNFGDNGLFFQHCRKEDDFAIRPDWVSYAQQMADQQANTPYFNGPDDIPQGP